MGATRIIYLDHSATTYVKPDVAAAMAPYHSENFGNPSSIYRIARTTRNAVDTARMQVAKALGAEPDEIYFTSGGSESDNWAIKGIAFANRKKGNHIITSAIEHHAVIHTCQYLEKQGFTVTYLPVDEFGLVNPAALEAAITDQTILVSIMYANNEIGTIEPIADLGAIAKKHKIPFHTDAVQAIGNVQIDVKAQNIDLLSLSAHKFYGPKGVGVLYIKKGTKIDNLIHGGGQERRRRAGTENIAGIVGLGKAIELATADIEGHNARIRALRDRLRDGILTTIPSSRLNGHPVKRLPGNINISFEFIEGESMLLWLDD
ncbi:MAG TPA: aminotransferase class V-fold PLP-dependent enzyme, partial [Methanoregula sp.]|nr:aminotransferase class V-fold PLP-dependent enzyme [Methanoregula sp.]